MTEYLLVALAIALAVLYFGRYLLPTKERLFLARPWVRIALGGLFVAATIIILAPALLYLGLALFCRRLPCPNHSVLPIRTVTT